ncbi:MAG: hypothetical protein WC272_04015 [Sulfurimonas sp.]|jgi:hypothetical protein
MEVKDIWLALQKTGQVFLGVSVVGLIAGFGLNNLFGTDSNGILYGAVIIANIIAAKFIFGVWNSYSDGIVADIENNIFSFPASDVENSIQDILTLRPLFDLAKRIEYQISEINALTNETKRWTTKSKNSQGRSETKEHVKWLLNISGEFGSKQLEFTSKQKRDECRAMLNSACKKIGSSFASSDINLDL